MDSSFGTLRFDLALSKISLGEKNLIIEFQEICEKKDDTEPIAKLPVPEKSPFLAILPLRRQVLISRVCPWRRSSGRVATPTNWPKIIDFSGAGSFAIGSTPKLFQKLAFGRELSSRDIGFHAIKA
jgi:hypothetical protein